MKTIKDMLNWFGNLSPSNQEKLSNKYFNHSNASMLNEADIVFICMNEHTYNYLTNSLIDS